MDRASQDLSNSKKFRYIIIYLAVATTLAVFGSGWNQHAVCSTQQENVRAIETRNLALDNVIDRQVALYRVVKNTPFISSGLKAELNTSIATLEKSKEIIKDAKPTEVNCLLVGDNDVTSSIQTNQ